MIDHLKHLKELAELRDSGALTDEEFDIQETTLRQFNSNADNTTQISVSFFQSGHVTAHDRWSEVVYDGTFSGSDCRCMHVRIPIRTNGEILYQKKLLR